MDSIHEADIQVNKTDKPETEEDARESADFETALTATGFGKFNYLLIAMIIPCTWSQVFEAHNMSYIIPVAQCDLDLNLDAKGQLNSVSFAGMITSGFFWGFLSDKFGRRKIMLFGYFVHFTFMLLASVSQNFKMLLTAKFFGGLIVNGPTSAAISLLAEFHISKYRAKIQLIRGVMIVTATLVLPLLSWLVLPRNVYFDLLGLEIHAWNIFLLICALPPLISGTLLLTLMPESPKFLMSAGRHQAALRIFRRIYRMNTGNSGHTFPIKQLIDRKQSTFKSIEVTTPEETSVPKRTSKSFMDRIMPLCVPPYVYRLILACANAFLTLMSTNTLKFWQPQLLQAINDYKYINDGASSSMCDMLEMIVPKNATTTSCTVNLNNSSVYINSIIISCTQLLLFAVAGTLVSWLGKKTIIVSNSLIAGACALSIYFAKNSETLIALFAIFSATAALCNNVSATITLEMFPTSIRTTTLSLHMMSSRIGSVLGNLVFPSLLNAGCLPPFFFIALSISSAAVLSIFFPNTENQALK